MPRYIILLLIITINGSALTHADKMRGPNTLQKNVTFALGANYRLTEPTLQYHQQMLNNLSAQYGYTFLKLYQNGLGKFIPSHCPMQPSCSRYSIEAISQHGLIKGVILTADRLLHETDEAIMVKKIWIKGRGHCCLDPVSRNVMWAEKNSIQSSVFSPQLKEKK